MMQAYWRIFFGERIFEEIFIYIFHRFFVRNIESTFLQNGMHQEHLELHTDEVRRVLLKDIIWLREVSPRETVFWYN